NVEHMINARTGDINKDHTTNPVPFLIIANEFKTPKVDDREFCDLSSRVPAGVVSDIAPTILELFGLEIPKEMTGVNLLEIVDEVPRKI
ncbi:MAG: hypothetical protein AAB729_02140, partial [Patescibacteria group bacterium]